MPDAYNLKDIAAALGLKSVHAARKRVNALRELLVQRELLIYIPKQGGALGVKPEGLELLKKLQEIGGEGKTLAQAAEALLVELGEKEDPPDAHELRLFKVELGDLRRRIENLERKVEKKRWWERVLALPRGKEEK